MDAFANCGETCSKAISEFVHVNVFEVTHYNGEVGMHIFACLAIELILKYNSPIAFKLQIYVCGGPFSLII